MFWLKAKLKQPLNPLLGLFILAIGAFVILYLLQTRIDPDADQSFLTDKPCAAPCWYGLEIDTSSKDEVINVIQELLFVDGKSATYGIGSWADYDNAETITFSCIHPQKPYCVSAIIADDKLKQLSLAVNFNLSMDMVINKLGPPDYIEYHVKPNLLSGCALYFSWTQVGILLDADPDYGTCNSVEEGNKIASNFALDGITYISPDAIPAWPSGCCTRYPWPGLSEP